MNTMMAIDLLKKLTKRSVLSVYLLMCMMLSLSAASVDDILESYRHESRALNYPMGSSDLDAFYLRWSKQFESMLDENSNEFDRRVVAELVAIKTALEDYEGGVALLSKLIEGTDDSSEVAVLTMKKISLQRLMPIYERSPKLLSLAYAEAYQEVNDFIGNPLIPSSFLVEYALFIKENQDISHEHTLNELLGASKLIYIKKQTETILSDQKKGVLAQSLKSVYYLYIESILSKGDSDELQKALESMLSVPFVDDDKVDLILSHGSLIAQNASSDVVYYQFLERNVINLEVLKSVESLIQLGRFYQRRQNNDAADSIFSRAQSLYDEDPSFLENEDLIPWIINRK